MGFGDFNEITGEVDDISVTNNLDRDRVLGTIAASALYFFRRYPAARIIFTGSTPARMRLYIIQIARHWNSLNSVVRVHGLINDKWEPFQRDRRYTAILIERGKL